MLQALALIRRMRTDLRKEIHRLSERQTKASRVLAQQGIPAATTALEAVCAQLDFVRSLRELYSAELAAHVASYNLVRCELPLCKLTTVAIAFPLTQTQCLQSAAGTLCAGCGSCTALNWPHMWQAITWCASCSPFLTRHLLHIHGPLHRPHFAQSLSPIQRHVLGPLIHADCKPIEYALQLTCDHSVESSAVHDAYHGLLSNCWRAQEQANKEARAAAQTVSSNQKDLSRAALRKDIAEREAKCREVLHTQRFIRQTADASGLTAASHVPAQSSDHHAYLPVLP